MRTFVMTILLLMLAGSGIAADKPAAKDSGKSPVAVESNKSPEKKVVEEKSSAQWPRPYKSTEEVSADSVVPFPTDI